MSSDTEKVQKLVEELEQVLARLDEINAKIAAIHVDIAIVELCQQADITRTSGSIKAA